MKRYITMLASCVLAFVLAYNLEDAIVGPLAANFKAVLGVIALYLWAIVGGFWTLQAMAKRASESRKKISEGGPGQG